jgi:hypothetical protein
LIAPRAARSLPSIPAISVRPRLTCSSADPRRQRRGSDGLQPLTSQSLWR